MSDVRFGPKYLDGYFALIQKAKVFFLPPPPQKKHFFPYARGSAKLLEIWDFSSNDLYKLYPLPLLPGSSVP